MRFILLILFLLGGVTLWQSCKTTKYQLNDYDGPKLVFGNGGGFTGAFQEYWVLPNGQLFLSKNGGDVVELPKIKKREAKNLFKSAEKLDLLNLSYDKPGNMYFSVQYLKDGKHSKAVWGKEEHLKNPILDELYSEFIVLVPKPKPKKASSK